MLVKSLTLKKLASLVVQVSIKSKQMKRYDLFSYVVAAILASEILPYHFSELYHGLIYRSVAGFLSILGTQEVRLIYRAL